MKSLRELYQNVKDECDKGTTHGFIEFYEALLFHYRLTAVRVLEVGVWRGGSLRLWESYFNSSCQIVGIDIGYDKRWGKADVPTSWSNRVEIIIGDSTNPEICRQLLEGGKFDVIIDDGSHAVIDQIATHGNLAGLLKSQGIYVIEDVGSVIEDTSKGTIIQRMSLDECVSKLREAIPNLIVLDGRAAKGKYNDVLAISYGEHNAQNTK